MADRHRPWFARRRLQPVRRDAATALLTLLLLLIAATGCRPAPDRPAADAADAAAGADTDADAGFAEPPVTRNPSLDGTPYADYRAPTPRPDASAASGTPPVRRYRNGQRVEEPGPPVILLSAELGETREGRLTVPAFVGDISYFSARVETESQQPLTGQALTVRSGRGNPVLLMQDETDDDGYLDFRVLANVAGRDELVVTAAGVETRFVLDVQVPDAGEWFGDLDLAGVIGWDRLIATPIDFGRDAVRARFPADLLALDGKSVRLAGFMLPLEPTLAQRRFLLTANPPACFFHPPGGPTSVAEVTAAKGIETSFDALVLEGRLRLVPRSEGGIVYRLEQARVVSRN